MSKKRRSHRVRANVSEVIDLTSYFRDCASFVCDINPELKLRCGNQVKKQFDISDSDLEELKAKFAPSRFSWKNIPVDKVVLPVDGFLPEFKLYDIPKKPKLKSLWFLQKRIFESKKRRKKIRRKIRYPGQVDVTDIPEFDDNVKGKEKLKDYSDFILTVRVFIPGKHFSFTPKKRTQKLRISHELEVYGNQTLDHLRDRMMCPEDLTPAEGDVSQNPFQVSLVNCDSVYRSAMFFINNNFYIDGRFPENIDYSEVVRNWAEGKKICFQGVSLMEETKICDLKFRLGYPYLFLHQGSCEHLVMFVDARLFGPGDLAVKSAYPILKSYASLRGKPCGICSKKLAKFIVFGTSAIPEWKTYVCGYCLHRYLYINGKKVDNFTVYKYVDRVVLF